MVRALRPNLRKAVLHGSLNLPYQDKLSDKQFAQLGNDYLEGMGFDDNQFIIYRHNDQDHQHIHITANRVKYSGKVVDDSWDLFRSKKLVRKMEEKYGLVQLEETTKKKKSPITQKELEKALRTGEAPIRFILQEEVKRAVGSQKESKTLFKTFMPQISIPGSISVNPREGSAGSPLSMKESSTRGVHSAGAIHGISSVKQSIMNKTETFQLFSMLIQQNKEIGEKLSALQEGHKKLHSSQQLLIKSQHTLLKNQTTIWDTIKRMIGA